MTGREATAFPNHCAGCGAAVSEWDDQYGYYWDERDLATCGATLTAHYVSPPARETS